MPLSISVRIAPGPGNTRAGVSAIEKALNHLLDDRTEKTVLLLKATLILNQEPVGIGALAALLFTYIFIKGREGKGISEGVRFGIIIWLFVNVPMGASIWVFLPIPYMIIVRGLLFGLLEMLVAGILVAVIYKPLSAPAKA